jgi:Cu+-exporting ATPase
MNTIKMIAHDDVTSLDEGRITFGLERETEAVQHDPVCGAEVIPASAAATKSYRGVDYYFCSRGCEDNFVSDPSHYVG